MSIDTVLMMLCDRKQLLTRQREVPATMATALPKNKDGLVRGRAADGSVIYAKVGGKSVARQLMEAKAKREAEAKRLAGPVNRRRRRPR
jgi:hypothetical protein